MKKITTHPSPDYRPPNALRRMLVGGIAVGYATSLLPSGFIASAFAADASTAGAPAVSTSAATFNEVSLVLTGRTALDAIQAQRLLAALEANDPQFASMLGALANFIATRKPDPLAVQQALDAEKATFASLPRAILTAWYVGVVGSNEQATCVAYESSLMYMVVADQLKPPSYAYGAYGSWAAKPA
jgi:hypothetical protein